MAESKDRGEIHEMTIYKITLDKDTNPVIERDFDYVMEIIKDNIEHSEYPNKIIMTIEILDMTEEEYNNFHEWYGP